MWCWCSGWMILQRSCPRPSPWTIQTARLPWRRHRWGVSRHSERSRLENFKLSECFWVLKTEKVEGVTCLQSCEPGLPTGQPTWPRHIAHPAAPRPAAGLRLVRAWWATKHQRLQSVGGVAQELSLVQCSEELAGSWVRGTALQQFMGRGQSIPEGLPTLVGKHLTSAHYAVDSMIRRLISLQDIVPVPKIVRRFLCREWWIAGPTRNLACVFRRSVVYTPGPNLPDVGPPPSYVCRSRSLFASDNRARMGPL